MGVEERSEGSRHEATTGGSNQLDHHQVWERVLAHLPVVVWTTDADLRITTSLGGGLLAQGLRPGQLVGVMMDDYLASKEPDSPLRVAQRRAVLGEDVEYLAPWNGREYRVNVGPMRDLAGVVCGTAGVARDITNEQRAERALLEREEELRSAQKLEGLGRLAREVGHDIAGHAAGAEVRLKELLAACPPNGINHDNLVEIARALERISALGVQLSGNGSSVPRDELAGGETILLVDDEPTVRGFVRRALELYGYRVLDTGGSQEALTLGSSFPGNIHLLLADVVLPGMSGPQLAARLAPMRPEMRILYMTGFADDALVDRGVVSAGQSLLVKPFTSVGLAHEVKKVLRT